MANTHTKYAEFTAYNKDHICMGIYPVELLAKNLIDKYRTRAEKAAGENGHVEFRIVQYVAKGDHMEAVAI